ncbi:MAG: hypothetical protein ACYSWO_08560 [Planctomycetota bacterium]|jgi:hypothetical protein
MDEPQYYRVYMTLSGVKFYWTGKHWSEWRWAGELLYFDEAKLMAESEQAQYEPVRSRR